MVELGDHCETHVVPRMKKVIDGDDPGGITEAVGWKGGGGYRYYRMAPSLLEKDAFGQWVISPAYNAEMLAEAMCVHFGFHLLAVVLNTTGCRAARRRRTSSTSPPTA